MDEFLTIVNKVIRTSESSFMSTGKDIDRKCHPEDLMIVVQSVAESVALTLTAIDQLGWVERKPTKKK
jgi:hypothetical protein